MMTDAKVNTTHVHEYLYMYFNQCTCTTAVIVC